MYNYLILILAFHLTTCIGPGSSADSAMTSSPEVSSITVSIDSNRLDHATIAFAAVDRQCGSCHHGDRSTNTGALAIFNLTDTCWYCRLTSEQCESFKGRISGASFSEEERTAIVALIAHLSEKNEDRTH